MSLMLFDFELVAIIYCNRFWCFQFWFWYEEEVMRQNCSYRFRGQSIIMGQTKLCSGCCCCSSSSLARMNFPSQTNFRWFIKMAISTRISRWNVKIIRKITFPDQLNDAHTDQLTKPEYWNVSLFPIFKRQLCVLTIKWQHFSSVCVILVCLWWTHIQMVISI